MAGKLDRRPRASSTPKGKDNAIPATVRKTASIAPPHPDHPVPPKAMSSSNAATTPSTRMRTRHLTSHRGRRSPAILAATAAANRQTTRTMGSTPLLRISSAAANTASGHIRRAMAQSVRGGTRRAGSSALEAADAPRNRPTVIARTNAATQGRHSWSRGNRSTRRSARFLRMISQRPVKKTNRTAATVAHPARTPNTTVSTPLYQVLKRFSRTHWAGVRRRVGGAAEGGSTASRTRSVRSAIRSPSGPGPG